MNNMTRNFRKHRPPIYLAFAALQQNASFPEEETERKLTISAAQFLIEAAKTHDIWIYGIMDVERMQRRREWLREQLRTYFGTRPDDPTKKLMEHIGWLPQPAAPIHLEINATFVEWLHIWPRNVQGLRALLEYHRVTTEPVKVRYRHAVRQFLLGLLLGGLFVNTLSIIFQ